MFTSSVIQLALTYWWMAIKQCIQQSTQVLSYQVIRQLYLSNVDDTWFKIKDEITQKRTRSLDAKFGSLPEIDLKDAIYRKTNAIKLAQLKEIIQICIVIKTQRYG